MKSVQSRIIVAAISLIFSHGKIFATPQYSVLDIGALTGGSSIAYGINSSGQVVGAAQFSTNPSAQSSAFLYSAGVMKNIGTNFASSPSKAYGINDAGNVVGEWDEAYKKGFYYSNGVMTILATLGGLECHPKGINDFGQITGYSTTADGNYRAFLNSSGTISDLGTLGGQFSFAFAINKSGQVTGQAYTISNSLGVFLYSPTNASMINLGNPFGADQGTGLGINESGQVVGYALNSAIGLHRAFFYTGGTNITLGTLGGSQNDAYGINAAGDIVGSSKIVGNLETHGFIYTGGVMYDLNDLIPIGTGITDIDLPIFGSNPINDLGQIAAHGTVGGQRHALLLTPTSLIKPILAISQTGPSTIISWPSPSLDYVLQENTNLADTNGWTNYGGTVSSNSTTLSVTLTPAAAQKFYRLKK
jgi:probable HAF family extracellular repeat protein